MVVDVFPADAGMNRMSRNHPGLSFSVPRRRGDEPNDNAYGANGQRCSPQMRGWTVDDLAK